MTDKEMELLQELLKKKEDERKDQLKKTEEEKTPQLKKNDEFKFEITDHIATLSSYTVKGKYGEEEWTKEVNRVSFNGGKPMVDIRPWNKDHTRMGKGVRLNAEEEEMLIQSMTEVPFK